MWPPIPRIRIRFPVLHNPPLFPLQPLTRQTPPLSKTLALQMGSQGKRPFCPFCSKPSRLCLCNRFKSHPFDNSISITVLQHSHEKNHALNSTRIALLGLKNIVVAPVSDVHFQAQFVIRSIKNDHSCSSRGIAVTGSECEVRKVDFHLGERDFGERFDFSMTQKAVGELGSRMSVVGSDLENQGHGNELEKVGFDRIVDSLKTQKTIVELGSGMSVVGSDLERQGHGNNLGNGRFDCILDSLKTQKASAELDSGAFGVVSDLENQGGRNPLENGGDCIADSLKTQKIIAEGGSGASGTAIVSDLEQQRHGNLQENGSLDHIVDSLELGFCKNQEGNCGGEEGKPDTDCGSNATAADTNSSLVSNWNDHESPDFDRVLDSFKNQDSDAESYSQNGVLVSGLENCNCHSNLQSLEKITVSQMEENGTHLQSSKKQISKSVDEKTPVSLAESKIVLELDAKTGNAARVEGESLLTGLHCGSHCTRHSEKLDFEQVPVTLTGDTSVSATDSEAILNAESVITDLLPGQNSPKGPGYDRFGVYPTDEEAVITATITKPGIDNASGDLDFNKLSASPKGKYFISNGFIVKKLQREQLGDRKDFEEFEITIPPGSALLFPSKKAISMEAVDFEVKHLIVLDGTWAKAKRMYHENPWLNLLPHLKLDPREMSLYSEVRLQPKAGCLSTVESIVYALKALGDDNVGLDDLLDVFESMVVDQRRCKVERLSKLSSA
eukprot:TRINITY_DN10152_c0_g2_i2.p1 TRINITY_DN10152_c0_g2~~TRINITY_DN10152_c0_g2_i2.p1  ORF type:complete len:727 (+),score=163.61 TRINITY_DN10152_c0_g2_i2:117-2297(+)